MGHLYDNGSSDSSNVVIPGSIGERCLSPPFARRASMTESRRTGQPLKISYDFSRPKGMGTLGEGAGLLARLSGCVLLHCLIQLC